MIHNIQQPTAVAVPVNVNYKSKFKRRYVLLKKGCLFYKEVCSLTKNDDNWEISYPYNNFKYKFRINNIQDYINIIKNLSLTEGKFKIRLFNNFNFKLRSIYFTNLDDTLEWCYNIDDKLSFVQIVHSNTEKN